VNYLVKEGSISTVEKDYPIGNKATRFTWSIQDWRNHCWST